MITDCLVFKQPKTEEDLRELFHVGVGQYKFSSMSLFIDYVPILVELGILIPKKLDIIDLDNIDNPNCAELHFMTSEDFWVLRNDIQEHEMFWDAYMPFTKRSNWYIIVPITSLAYSTIEALLVMQKLKG